MKKFHLSLLLTAVCLLALSCGNAKEIREMEQQLRMCELLQDSVDKVVWKKKIDMEGEMEELGEQLSRAPEKNAEILNQVYTAYISETDLGLMKEKILQQRLSLNLKAMKLSLEQFRKGMDGSKKQFEKHLDEYRQYSDSLSLSSLEGLKRIESAKSSIHALLQMN